MNERSQNQAPLRVAVLGGGAWGTTLAMVSVRAGNPTTLIVRNEDAFRTMTEERRHPRSLQGIPLPQELEFSTEPSREVDAADIVILAIPTQEMRHGIQPIAERLRTKIVVSAAKGIEIRTLLLPTAIVKDVVGSELSVCALSGPNLSNEVAAGKPTTTVIASDDEYVARRVQSALMSRLFRVYTSHDVLGVELGGALKNIIAIGAGIGDGLQAGDNAKAAFLTRGIAEMTRLGIALGAEPLTFAGLSGIGDLIATCASDLSRNHKVGMELASGASLQEVLAGISEVAEGVDTTRAAIELARQSGTEMPIAEQMHEVLFAGKSPVKAVQDLMIREPRQEVSRSNENA